MVYGKNMSKDIRSTLLFDCADNELSRLSTVLQSGFVESGRQGDSILSFLLTLEGFSEAYIEDEVQTIFYNGDALDGPDTKLGGASATIALGSAMPGLAGAIMKKGSICGAFRKNPAVSAIDSSGDPVTVLVKLFNTVSRDRGPQLLKRGVRVGVEDLRYFLSMRPRLVSGLKNINLCDQAVHPEELVKRLPPCDDILIKTRNHG